MKKSIVIILCATFLVLSLGLPLYAEENNTLKGTLIDNMCATANKDNLAEFIKTHTKECALMPDCAASGYAIYTDGKLLKFDSDSSAKIEEFLKQEESTLEVEVVAGELSLVSLENAPMEPGPAGSGEKMEKAQEMIEKGKEKMIERRKEKMIEEGKEKVLEKGKEKMMEQGAKEMMKGSGAKAPEMP